MLTARIRKYRNLTPSERQVVRRSLVMLPATAAALRVAGPRRVHRWLNGRSFTPDDTLPDPTVTGHRLAWLVNAAARRGLWRANCLQRSMVSWRLLREQGIDSELRLGVRRDGTHLLFHAWLERDGVVLNDRLDVGELYKPFAGGLDRHAAFD